MVGGERDVPASNPQLESDFAVFEQHRKDWVTSHNGEYVLIHQEQLAGFYPDYEAALRSGLKLFGVQSQFLITQVCVEEPVFVIY